jgi:hypothetical protein
MMRRSFPVLAVLALLSGALGACQSSQPETPRGPTGQLEQVLLTDVDGDGDGDLVSVGDFADGPIRVQQRGTAAVLPDVTATLALPTSGSGRRVASGDLDGDGDLDLVLCTTEPGRSLGTCRVLFNCLRDSGAPRFDCRRERLPLGKLRAWDLPALVRGRRQGWLGAEHRCRGPLLRHDLRGACEWRPVPVRR